MKLGFSVDFGYLAGETTADRSAIWRTTFGRPRVFLKELRARGISSVELRTVRPGTAPSAALRASEIVWGAGLQLTIHGVLPDAPQGEIFAEAFPAIARVARERPRTGEGLCVTVHPASASSGDVASLADRTVETLDAVAGLAEREGLSVRFAIELNRAKGRADPGTTYGGLLEIVRRTARPSVGICWDFGHTMANVRQGLIALEPPLDFVQLVTHTHVHGLGREGRTHCAPGPDNPPLRTFLHLLSTAGYSGILNIEIGLERMHNAADPRSAVLAGIDHVRQSCSEL